MARSLDDIFGSQQSKPRTLEQIFAPPPPDQLEATRTPLAMQMRPAHSDTIELPKPSLKTAFIGGTLNSLAGKALTPLAEKITGREVDLSTLPQPETLGQKAVSIGSNLAADLPLWLGGDALLAKPLSALAKTAPVSRAIGALPKALTPALGTGVRAGATYGGVIAPAETALEGDGLQGLIQREKQVPLMALGGAALHRAGQLIGSGVKSGLDYAKFNKLTKLPEMQVNPLDDVQNAYRVPSLRDVRAQELANPLPLPQAGTQPLKSRTFLESINDAAGVREPLTPVQRHKVMNNLQRTFAREQPIESQRFMPEPISSRTWTNREGIPNAGQLPIKSITEDTLNRLPKAPRPTGTTVDLEIPIVNGRPDTANAVERTRVVNAAMESPQTNTLFANLPRSNQTGGNADTFRAKIDRNPVKPKTFSETLKGLRTQLVDDLAPLENLEKNVTGKIASAEDSLYKQGRLFRGSPERADELIKTRLAPIMKQVEKTGKTSKDLGDYSLAVHARDVNAKGINSGFTNDEIAATIQKYGTPEMEAARKELLRISNESLESLADAGLISRDLVTELNQRHPNYMPLFRSFDDEKIEFASGVSKALANVSAPIDRLSGSNRNVIDPIESMIKNIYRSVSAVDRNKVATQLGKLVDQDTNASFIRRLPEGEERARLNAVYAMENGQKTYYEVQPDVYRALMNLDKESSNMLIKVLQKPAGLLRAGATLTPEFSLRNPMRDVVQAFVTSKSGFNPITDPIRGLIDVIGSKFGKETMYNNFLRDSGGFGNIISMDRKAHQEVLESILKQPNSKKFVNVVSGKPLINILRTITDVTESATKLGEYRAALRSGASRQEAAYRARDLMDFARAGASIRETNKIVAFLNANIQGKSKLLRAIKEDPVGVTARAFTSITLPTVGVYLAQKYLANDEQRKTIEDAPDWLTSTFWLIPIPGTSQVARIPKPFDLAPIFANIPERALKYFDDNDPEAFEGFGKQTLASASIPTMITGLIPFVEGMANYSFFRQSPIIPQRESDLNYPDQYDINTTETAKFLAKGVNALTGGQGTFKNFGSPRVMDNTIKGATAGLGTYATSAIDLIAETTGLVDKKQKPARNINELPLLRAFLVSEKTGGKAMNKLYNEKDELLRAKGSAKIDNPKAKFPQESSLKKLNTTTDEISKITKEIRSIENSKLMNPLEKRTKINTLTDRRNDLARKTIGK